MPEVRHNAKEKGSGRCVLITAVWGVKTIEQRGQNEIFFSSSGRTVHGPTFTFNCQWDVEVR